MKIRLAVMFSVLLALASAASAAKQGTERILEYHSDITVGKDGWLTVTETIQVRCARQEINQGIYRDFPVLYVGRGRRRIIVPFEVVGVLRDGKPEAYHIESKDNCRRVYIGRKGKFLSLGVYTYALTYRTNRQILFLDNHDELYWNVTGNDWIFPIDKASAKVTLPSGVPVDKITCEGYTGEKGAKGKNYSSSVDASGKAIFHTTRSLAKNEGLTIVFTIFWPGPKWGEIQPGVSLSRYSNRRSAFAPPRCDTSCEWASTRNASPPPLWTSPSKNI
jgi:hypothetical protein